MIKSYAKKALLQRYLSIIACHYEFCEANKEAKKQTNHQITFEEQQQINHQTQANFLLQVTMQKYYKSIGDFQMLKKINEIFKQKRKIVQSEDEEEILKEHDEFDGQDIFQQGSYREYIHEKDVEKATQDIAFDEIKPIRLTPEGIQEMIEYEEDVIYEENNPALFDEIVELETIEGELTMNGDGSEFDADEFYEELLEYFNNGMYRVLNDEQFIDFLFNRPDMEKILLSLPAQFYIQNEHLIQENNIQQIIHQLQKRNISRLNILRYCTLRSKFNYFSNFKDFQSLVKKYPADISLIIQYFFFNENKQNFYCQDSFLKSIIRINWGGSKNSSMFMKQLPPLLSLKFKIQTNKDLQVYLADLFFGSDTFDKGIVAISLHYLLFQRLALSKDVQDILEVFKSTFGQERYNFYLEQEFPQILRNLKVQSYIITYQNGLRCVNQQNKSSIATLQSLTNLDRIFIKSHKIKLKQTIVYYNPHLSDLLQQNKDVVEDLQRQKIKQAVLHNKYEFIEKELSKELQYSKYQPNIAELAHQYIYQEQLHQRNLNKQCLSEQLLNDIDDEQDITLNFQKMSTEEQNALLDEDEQALKQFLLESQVEGAEQQQAQEEIAEEGAEEPALKIVQEQAQEAEEVPAIEASETTKAAEGTETPFNIDDIKTIEDILQVPPEQQKVEQRMLTLIDDLEGPGLKIYKKLIEQQPEVQKKRQQLFGNKNQFPFCTTTKDLNEPQEAPKNEPQEAPKNETQEASKNETQEGKGFMNYLKSVQSIDLEIAQQQELNKQQQKLQEVRKPGKILLDQQEITNLKQIFSEDAMNVSKLKQEIKPQPVVEKFERVRQTSKQHFVKAEEQVQRVVFKDEQLKKQVPLIKEEFVSDNQLYNSDFVNQAKFHIELLFKGQKSKKQLIEDTQTYLSGIQNRDDGFHFYLISELIQALENHRPEDSQLVFAQIILSVENKIAVKDVIKVKYQTQYGDIEKDFGKYIKQTCTRFSLGSKGYNYLLDFLGQQDNYNRLLYKRVLAHYCLHETVLYDSTFERISEITKENKIPQTCAEWIYALVFKKIVINKTQMRRIAQLLYQFKHFEAEVEQLIITLYHSYQWEIKFSDVEPIIMKLLNQSKRDRYMSIYESLKDQVMARKLKQLPTDPAEMNKAVTEYKQHQKEMMRQFVRSYAQLLLNNQLPDDARLIINDAKRLRYPYEILDYELWLLSHVHFLEDALKIYNDFCVKFPEVYDESIFKAVLTILQAQDFVFDSVECKKLFHKLMEQYIYEKRLSLTHDLIYDITNTYKKLREYTNYQNFLKFLVQIRYKCINSHKFLFYKMMNLTETDSVKESIKGIIELLFHEEYQQRKVRKGRKGDEDSEEKEQKEKVYDLGQRGPNPLHSQEIKLEPTKLEKGKRSKITRGGKIKFKEVVTNITDQGAAESEASKKE